MRFEKLPKATIRTGDSKAMKAAIELLHEHGVDVRRPVNANGQLKLDERTSYYPSKGTFFIDRESEAREERGIEALKNWIDEQVPGIRLD